MKRLFLLILITIAGLLFCTFVGLGITNITTTVRANKRNLAIFNICQSFTTNSLKAPATAKFPEFNIRMLTEVDDGSYTVKSYVDAQNGFGALIRSDFVCHVKPVAGSWVLLDLSVQAK
jgi:hypothetical protein